MNSADVSVSVFHFSSILAGFLFNVVSYVNM